MRKKVLIAIAVLFILVFGKVLIDVVRFSPVFFQLLFNKEISLKKEDDNNINLLLLGIGGGNHEGFDLTDTILFANINQKKNKITLVSIPRDLWVPDLNAKINTAYHSGESQREGGGLILAKAAVSAIVGQQISYAVLVDFNGFVKAVDLIGGIDVEVENILDDYEYPIEGKENDACGRSKEEVEILATSSAQLEAFPCRYKYLHFDKGLQHMDGKTALEFVRSRHARGEEGTDFARSRRQTKVISAFKEKVFSLGTFLNPAKVLNLYSILKESIDTDIQDKEYDDFIRLAQKMKNSKIQSAVLDSGDEGKNRPGLLISPSISTEYQGQWVLTPRIGNGDFSEIETFVSCVIKNSACLIKSNP